MISLKPVPAASTAEPRYYSVSVRKLCVLWLATLGIYGIYWHYKNWQLERDRGADVIPWARAIFQIFFTYSLFQRIRDDCLRHKIEPRYEPALLAVVYIVLFNFAYRLPDPWTLVAFLAFVPVIPIQTAVNELNQAVAPDVPVNDRFPYLQLVLTCLGLLFFLAVVLGTFMPGEVAIPAPSGDPGTATKV